MRVVDHHSEQVLQQLRADRAQRLRTVLLAKQGFTAPEIATCTGFSRRSVQEWVARYNAAGLAGLETASGRGRKPPLTPEQVEQLQRRLDAGPLPEDGVCTLRGKDVQRILHGEFGQLRSLNAVYGRLHRLGYSSLIPRPQHPEADPAAQEEFKKVWRSARRDPIATSRPPVASLPRGRSAVRTTGDADPSLGSYRFATACRPTNTVRVHRRAGSDMRRDGSGRGADRAASRHRHREHLSRSIVADAGAGRAGGARLGWRGRSSIPRLDLPVEHHADEPATVLARTESGGKLVA